MAVIILKNPELEAFWENDILDFTTFPDNEISEYFISKFKAHRALDLAVISSETKKNEIKDIFRSCIEAGKPYTHKSKYFNHLFYMAELANSFKEDSFLMISEDKCKELYKEVITKNEISQDAIKLVPSFLLCLSELRDTRTGMDRDVWYFKDFHIDENRFNKSATQNTLNFRRIENIEHREHIKQWFKYLIGCTELSMASIINFLPQIVVFSNHFTNKSLFDVTEDDITEYVKTLTICNNAINKFLNSLSEFYNYMTIKEVTDKPCPVKKHHMKRENYIPKDNLVSEYVILQIFGNMNTLDHVHKCMYLINYCTGMRVSDVCQIPVDCLYEDGDDGYYIRINNSQKMQKTTINLIPPTLYKFLQQQVETILNLPYEEKYLFPSPSEKNKPFQSSTFRSDMKKWCKKVGIKNEDGSDYNYTTHAYRHTLSTDLFQNYGVDLQVIQMAVLWHQEIQMSLTYAQRSDEYNKALHDKYISGAGVKSPVNYEILENADALHKKALSDGYCNYPFHLGVCPNADVCLNCQFFRTSIRFLDAHKAHLEEVQKNIIFYKANGYRNNLATALETEKKLKKIIDTLQNL